MSDREAIAAPTSGQSAWFATTHWSVVLTAGQCDSPQAADALERLCRTYWYPLYAYVRREGYDEESAKDLTQGFFERFLEKKYLDQTQREKGKFRSFLLKSLKHFLSDQRDKARAQKRGGGKTFVSLDDSTCEDRYRLERGAVMNPEKLFDRRWALMLLEQAKERLKEEYVRAGKSKVYERLEVFDSGESVVPSYAEVAVELELTEGGVKAAVSRMRERHRELVREEVANTVTTPAEVDEEIRCLIRAISE